VSQLLKNWQQSLSFFATKRTTKMRLIVLNLNGMPRIAMFAGISNMAQQCGDVQPYLIN
jgi:hypothetical protein